MDMGITSKVALVLGAGGGLGGATAKALAREGARVICAGRTTESVRPTVDAIIAVGGTAVPAIFDLADLGAGVAAIDEAEGRIGPIDILINNTGGPKPTPATGQPPELWASSFASMVLPVLSITDRVLPGMRSRQWGRIVTSTSSGVVAPIAGLGISNTLRTSLLGWSKSVAREVAGDGVTVNVVVPGRISTRRTAFLDEQKAKREGRQVNDVVADSVASMPVGRYGKPEEFADTVVFLASLRASYITGAVIRVDGGLIASI